MVCEAHGWLSEKQTSLDHGIKHPAMYRVSLIDPPPADSCYCSSYSADIPSQCRDRYSDPACVCNGFVARLRLAATLCNTDVL